LTAAEGDAVAEGGAPRFGFAEAGDEAAERDGRERGSFSRIEQPAEDVRVRILVVFTPQDAEQIRRRIAQEASQDGGAPHPERHGRAHAPERRELVHERGEPRLVRAIDRSRRKARERLPELDVRVLCGIGDRGDGIANPGAVVREERGVHRAGERRRALEGALQTRE